MMFPGIVGGGFYGEDGHWVKMKSCLISCGAMCDCEPPLGQYYRPPENKQDEPCEQDLKPL